MSTENARAIVVVGHGAPARDTPPELVRRLRALEAARRRDHGPMSEEERDLDARVRAWPRTAENDPYREGIERLVARVRAVAGGVRVETAFNEFCAPSIPDVVAALATEGLTEIVLVPTMMTPGGVHSEVEIPALVAELSKEHPRVNIVYAWPFDLDVVAKVLVDRAFASR